MEVRSRRGRVEVAARITETIRPDTVFVPFHYPGLQSANRLTNPALDPISKMPEFKVCAVQLSLVRHANRASRKPDDAVICRCNNVTRGQLRARFDAGERTVLAVADSTHATTGCGTCHDAVARMLTRFAHGQPESVMRNVNPDKHVVVVGNGMVGQRFVELLADNDLERRWRITVLGEEPRQAYDRVALSALFDGKSAEDLDVVAPGCYDDDAYNLKLNEQVVAIDRGRRRVTTALGNSYHYDALVLATGSYPFVPPVPGRELPNCFVYRTIEDLHAIKAAVRSAKARNSGRSAGMVVGGGLLGLEAAHALRLLGISPHVVELAPRLMPKQSDDSNWHPQSLIRTSRPPGNRGRPSLSPN